MLIIIQFLNNRSEIHLFNSKTRMLWRVGLIADGPEAKAKEYWDPATHKWMFHNISSGKCLVIWINKSSKHDNPLIQGHPTIKWVTILSRTLEWLMQARSCQLRRNCSPRLLWCQQITHSTSLSSSKRRKLFIVTAMTSTWSLRVLKVGKVRHSRTCRKFLRYCRTPRLKRKIRSTKRLCRFCKNLIVQGSIFRKLLTSTPMEKSAMPLDNHYTYSLGAFTRPKITNLQMKHSLSLIANLPILQS